MPKLRIVYFGSSGDLSLHPFQALLDSSHEIVAVVVNKIPLIDQEINLIPLDFTDNIESAAFSRNIEILQFSDNLSELLLAIDSLSPDLIITSCFSEKIPGFILSIPKIASLNIHPSLLPRYRGPDPIFWQIRDAVNPMGVSIHMMDSAFDSGDIVAQQSVEIDPGINMLSLTQTLAKTGSSLLINTLEDIQRKVKLARPQLKANSSYDTFPQLSDFQIQDTWDAERIYRFMKITEGFTHYYPIIIGDETIKLTRVLEFSNHQRVSVSINQNKITIPCRKGYIVAEFLTPSFDTLEYKT